MTYKESITAAMTWLGEQPDTLFIGQSVEYPGTALFQTLSGIPAGRKIELPIAEEMQLGMTLGLALQGYCVISIIPRMDFLLLGMNQLINHIDKIPEMSENKMRPRIIIRTSVGAKTPLHGGPQHTQNYYVALKSMCKNINVRPLYLGYVDYYARNVITYQDAYYNPSNVPATIVIEDGGAY